MIPKIIHYCWFGQNELPPLAQACIETWHKYLPDYEIIKWDETNLPSNQFTKHHWAQSRGPDADIITTVKMNESSAKSIGLCAYEHKIFSFVTKKLRRFRP